MFYTFLVYIYIYNTVVVKYYLGTTIRFFKAVVPKLLLYLTLPPRDLSTPWYHRVILLYAWCVRYGIVLNSHAVLITIIQKINVYVYSISALVNGVKC